MDMALRIERSENTKVIAYADDIVVLIAGTTIDIIKRRAYGVMESLRRWAAFRGLIFSAGKTQVMSLRGGLKPGFLFNFGEDQLVASSPIRYLGVLVDYKRIFWEHIRMISKKSEDFYLRLRCAAFANWGAGQKASELIYRTVFIPRVMYASEI